MIVDIQSLAKSVNFSETMVKKILCKMAQNSGVVGDFNPKGLDESCLSQFVSEYKSYRRGDIAKLLNVKSRAIETAWHRFFEGWPNYFIVIERDYRLKFDHVEKFKAYYAQYEYIERGPRTDYVPLRHLYQKTGVSVPVLKQILIDLKEQGKDIFFDEKDYFLRWEAYNDFVDEYKSYSRQEIFEKYGFENKKYFYKGLIASLKSTRPDMLVFCGDRRVRVKNKFIEEFVDMFKEEEN